MQKKVKLKTIIDALEWVNDETAAYFDLVTGETVMWNADWDNEDSEGDLDEEMLEERLDAGRYISLPDKYEINEYHMMEAFAYDHDEHPELVRAIKGRGAFHS